MARQETENSVAAWSTSDLAAIYTSHSRAFISRALRYVTDPQVAEEIVQEAFIKVLLAAPEIKDRDHLIAYLNTTITNLSLNFRRDHGRGPLLVAVDSETSQSDIDALAAENFTELDEELTRAEDAAIVREALSRLTEADRMLILAVDVAEKPIAEIAAEYGMKEASVHNALGRARRNLRNVLETWIVDEETGMTAAQFLSKTYKKAAENSKKIGTAALSLVLVISAFFGFWNHPSTTTPLASPTVTVTVPPVTASPSPLSPAPTTTVTKTITASPAPSAPVTKPSPEELQTWALGFLASKARLGWPGLNDQDIPVGFTVNDGAGFTGLALLSQDNFVMDTTKGTVTTTSRFTTFQDGLNVILAQTITNTLGKVTYNAEPIVRVGGSWIALELSSTSTDVKQLEDGTYVITSWMLVDINKTAENTPIAGPGLGTDLRRVPAVIATRVHTTGIGQPVIAQAVQVLDPLAGQS